MRRYRRYVERLAYELPSVSTHGCVLHPFAVFSVYKGFRLLYELRPDVGAILRLEGLKMAKNEKK